jgi:hypothetical protein
MELMATRRKAEGKPPSRPAAAKSRRNLDQIEIPLRVTLVQPPGGVQFCVQGKTAADLEQLQVSTGGDLSFDFAIRVAPGGSGPPRFLGPYTHGPPSERFVYLCVGTLADQADSCWARRVKVPLSGITQKLLDRARRSPARRLEARVWGTAKDGGPVCASVPLMEDGWRLIE